MTEPKPVFIVVNDDNKETGTATLYDAGIVSADAFSTIKKFNLWNNKSGNTSIPDMINVDITVQDENSSVVDNRIVNWASAIMYCRFCDEGQEEGQKWGVNNGLENVKGEWEVEDEGMSEDQVHKGIHKGWLALRGSINLPVCSGIGDEEGYRVISGKSNNGNAGESVNYSNVAKMEFKMYCQPVALSETIAWKTVVKYQYS